MVLGFLAPIWEGNVPWLLCQTRAVEEAAEGKLGKRGQCLLYAKESLFSTQVSCVAQMCSWKNYWVPTAVLVRLFSAGALVSVKQLKMPTHLLQLLEGCEGSLMLKLNLQPCVSKSCYSSFVGGKKNPKWDERSLTTRKFISAAVELWHFLVTPLKVMCCSGHQLGIETISGLS